ncbi:neuronal acetylcholine receptor subunit alpha-10-like [Haliotis rufescens]|uniref:neuronal acetylcholine receptor subunit alpha-10-like n=1 Tax=Haliotis rufescens TaxID=6454 RepID=UPI001EB074EE|nr:neuronal acetylcholine receptor subunit alpha-10-like [Haliotis rufescens]XP_046367255.1 neuronal acetylcholine receptor subunit alpha-10-like [Haliotis rufescens]XP_046367256.1 neuronal acetylcholine receptor subunit alpha-10-like [Haliotis rufescens]XP_048256712.1 neuronal acetylcholine receptor subunit alpha-10-like [Haliotis rufescens]
MDVYRAIYGLAVLAMSLISTSSGNRGVDTLSYEDQLVKQILHKYRVRGKYSRPVRHFNDTLKVTFGIQLTQIMDLNEQDQILTLNVWDIYWWKDEQATWNMTEYGGVDKVRIPWNKVWLPDIKLYNYADYRLQEQRTVLCVFHHDGRVQWMPQAVYRSSCQIDVTTFPFDVQSCILKFGSWTYDGNKLEVHFNEDKDYIDLTEYVTSNAWTIIDVPAKRNVKFYSCCPEPYVDLTFTLIFQRRATLYNYILILPCVLLTSITLILFWIPPESPAKMMLGLTIFIAFFILLKILEKNLPPGTSSMPLIGTYYCLNMIIITLSSFLNVLVVNWAAYGQRANIPPPMKAVLFDVCAKVLHMEDLVRPFQKKDRGEEAAATTSNPGEEDTKWSQDPMASTEVLTHLKCTHATGPIASIDAKLGELREFIRAHKQRLADKDRRESMVKEWKASALILDRIIFVVYFLIIVTSLAVILPSIVYSADYQSTRLKEAFNIQE